MSRKTVFISFVLICFGFFTPFAKGPLARAATVSTITGVSVSGGPLVGGSTQTAAGTVTISPPNDVDVSIALGGANFQTNHPSGYLVIPAGSTSGNFTVVNTNFVMQNTTLTITAAGLYSNVQGQGSAQLTVTPIMNSVSLGPSSVVGGSTTDVNGSVTLVAAPRVALGVNLSSYPSVGTFVVGGVTQSYLTIPVGSSSGSFVMRTNAVWSNTTSTVTAGSYGGDATASLTVTTNPLTVSASPGSVSGGVGQEGTGLVTLSAPTRAATSVSLNTSPSVAAVTFWVNGVKQWYVPIAAGGSSASFTIKYGDVGSVITTNVVGTLLNQTGTASVTIYPENKPEGQGPCKDCNAGVGAPISLTNGNTWVTQRDYSLPGLGGGLDVTRTWNSLWTNNTPIETAGMFGHSWRSTYEERIQPGLHTKYWRSTGSAWAFAYDSVNGTYGLLSPLGEGVVLTYDSGTTLYTMIFRDGSKRIFNSSGYLTQIIDRNGNTTTVSYDGSNRITTVTDAASRTITFTYVGAGRQVQTVADATGTVATYLYDATPRLTKVTYADASFNTFTYDSWHRLLNVKDTAGVVLEAHTYDGINRGTISERASGVEKVTVSYPSATAARVTDSLARVTDYTHQAVGGRRWIMQISGSGCATCGGRGNATFAYDVAGNKVSSTDALSRTTNYTYDMFGNVLTRSVTLTAGTILTWTYTYNSLGQVLTATDPQGNVTTNTYDTKGNLLTTRAPSHDGVAAGPLTTFAYDVKGQLTSVTDPRNNATTMTYTAAGLIATVTDAASNVTSYGYDTRGNRTTVTDALGKVTTFAYNSVGRLASITAPNPAGGGSGGPVTTFAYDNRGRRTSVTDANSKATTYAYDTADRLTSVTDATSNATAYLYNTENDLTRITDAAGRATNFAYDNRGRVTTVTFPSTLAESYTYDAVGNLLTKTDRKAQTVTYSYDALDRLTRKQYPDTTGVDYTYDTLSRMTRVADATGTYDFAYDRLGRLTGTTTAYAFLTSRTFTMGYGYDAGSNRTSMTDPESGSTSYAYDALNRLTTLTPPSAITSGSFGFSYDVLSRRTQMTRPNGVNTDYAYDSLSRLLSVLHKLSGTTIDGASYTVDAVGNRTAKTNQLNAAADAYSYDSIYQLTQVVQTPSGSGPTTTESYGYDQVGNRTSSLAASPWSYNSSNHLTSIAGTPGTTFTYDNNGNTLTKVDAAGTTTYAWDYENRLTGATLPTTGGTVSFKYDPFGRRIQKATPSVTTVYAYDGETTIEETDATGAAQARFATRLSIDEPLAQLRNGATHYHSADGLGSITSLTNAAGAVTASYAYDAFGNATATTGSVANPFRYTSREWDSETGLYFHRARYYDSTAGRFLSEDPIDFSGGPNFYPYVGNDPVNWFDPDGLQRRDRGTTGRPDGTQNPFKHLKPHPTKPDKVLFDDPQTGKTATKAKPPGFDDYWEKKHGKKPATKPEECPKPEEPAKALSLEDSICTSPAQSDCIRMPDSILERFAVERGYGFLVPSTPGMRVPVRTPVRVPLRFPIVVFP